MKSTLHPQHRFALLLGIGCLLLSVITPARATITVANLDDSGPGSLRQAIADAAPGDTIDFAVTGTITLTSGELVITNDLTITGPGATNLTVSGNNASRMFFLTGGIVRMSGLTIANGSVTGSNGGGIYSSASLQVSNCAIVNNFANHGGAGIYDGGAGGGIYSVSSLVLVDTTITSNNANGYGGGGGIFVGGTVSITNVTISGNMTGGLGGGISGWNVAGSISSSSVTGNNGVFGGGVFADSTFLIFLSVRNSIIANNYAGPAHGSDWYGTVNSLDFNLIQDTNGATITGVTTHNLYGVDPLLGPLADNGGPTMTHALLVGSPALDAGYSGGLTADQRGQPRSVDFPGIANASDGDGSDIGAFELQDLPQTGPVFTVNTTQDANDGVAGILHCSLREAIADAMPGDTIDFAVTGTIALTSGELLVDKNLTISGPGASDLTVSGNNASRVFSFTNVTVAMSGLTVANGRIFTGTGAGINNRGGSLVLSNCSVTANNANDHSSWFCVGVGIYNSGVLSVIKSTVSDNHGDYSLGGGIYNSGTLKLINSTVSRNMAARVGGLVNYAGSCMITNTTISSNVARDNSQGAGGMSSGGGPGMVWLCNSTVCANEAEYRGGVWITASGTLHIFNSIVAGNTSRRPGAVSPDCFVDPNGSSLISYDYNLIGNTNGAIIAGVSTHNIYGRDPLLGPLADNGGPTMTHALLPGSPAIDHGSSGGLATDQRGLPRPFNFPAYFDADDGSDIGACELQEGTQTGSVFTVNTTDDADDGMPGIAHCSLREAINAAGTNTVTFAQGVPALYSGVTGTITLTNEIVIANNGVTIVGPGAAKLTVSGNNSNRVFRLPYTASEATISGLTIADGRTSGSGGGAGFQNSGFLTIADCVITNCTASNGSGGAIHNDLELVLIRSVVSGNEATFGGGIYNSYLGMLNLSDSTISSNVAAGGGGISNWRLVTITNSTISCNYASGSGDGGGGGINNQGEATLLIHSSTICSNSAPTYPGGGVHAVSGNVSLCDTILAGNSAVLGPDFSGSLNSLDYNLIQNTNDCTITNLTAHNLYNQDPKLGPLADLGGPTPTHALRFDSPALDAGHSGGLTTDQRGLPRPIDDPNLANAEAGDGSDIGAYEADPNLRIMAIEKVGSDIRLRFNTVLGRSYQLENEDDLAGPWNVLGADITGDGGSAQAVDAGAASLPKRFYRAGMLP